MFQQHEGSKEMKKVNTLIAVLLTTASLHSYADSGASNNGSAASKHSALAASHGVVGSAKVGSAVVATPLLIAGGLGHIAGESGKQLMDAAFSDEPLEVTDKTITAAPSPKGVMKINQPETL